MWSWSCSIPYWSWFFLDLLSSFWRNWSSTNHSSLLLIPQRKITRKVLDLSRKSTDCYELRTTRTANWPNFDQRSQSTVWYHSCDLWSVWFDKSKEINCCIYQSAHQYIKNKQLEWAVTLFLKKQQMHGNFACARVLVMACCPLFFVGPCRVLANSVYRVGGWISSSAKRPESESVRNLKLLFT